MIWSKMTACTFYLTIGICIDMKWLCFSNLSPKYQLLIHYFFSNLAPILDCANPYAYGTWTGGNDISVENSFVRIGLNTPFTFTNWYGSNPDDASTTELLDCVEIFYLGSWNDRPCPDFKPIICEK